MNSFDYDHWREKAYISNISDAFQRAEEETRKAEQMLEKWRQSSHKQSHNQSNHQAQLQATNIRTMQTG